MSPKQLFSQLHEKISEKFREVSFKLYERMRSDQATYFYWLLGASALGGVVDAPGAAAALLAVAGSSLKISKSRIQGKAVATGKNAKAKRAWLHHAFIFQPDDSSSGKCLLTQTAPSSTASTRA